MGIAEVKQAYSDKLTKKQNVVGAGIGEKWVDGKPTGSPAILVFVEKKFSQNGVISKFSSRDIVPKEIDGYPTDIMEVGRIRKQTYRSKVRPIKPGYSVGHGKITAGTIGGIFRDADGDVILLTNNHVASNENNAEIGDIIYQPGPMDSKGSLGYVGWPDPVAKLPYIGTLKKFMRLKEANNLHDSAIVLLNQKLLRDGLVDVVYPVINKRLNGFADPVVGTNIQKCGRTTGYTTGRIIGTQASFSVEYDFGNARFDDCIVTTPMSKGGDSGSLIMDMNMNAVALLFAGSNKVTIGNPIQNIINYYGLSLYKEPAPVQGLTFENDGWVTIASGESSLELTNGVLTIKAPANHHCYYEHAINSLNCVECVVNTGTDNGATWGPGITVQWPNGMFKVNLRSKGTFGGYYNSNASITIGRTQPNTNYRVRILKTANSWEGQVNDAGTWHTVIAVPHSIFPYAPIAVRVGKTNQDGYCTDYANAGQVGECSISDFKIS